MRRSLVSLLVLTLLVSPAAFAQFSEKIEVRVVNVDVTVTDRHGNPVSGLTRDDFEVFEDGRRQEIANFYTIENAVVRDEAAPDSSPSPATQPERFRRKVFVLINNANTSMHGRNEALEQLERFIDRNFEGDYEWSVATVDRRVHLLLPMTSDKSAIHDVFATVRKHPTLPEVTGPIVDFAINTRQPAQSFRTMFEKAGGAEAGPFALVNARLHGALSDFVNEAEATHKARFAASSMAPLLEAARAFGAIEGKKILLLITGDLPLQTGSPLCGGSPEQARNAVLLRDLFIAEANASNTSVYIIGADGLSAGGGASFASYEDFARCSPVSDSAAMYWIGRETGGAYLPGNFIDKSLREFDRRSANFYSLGYRSSSEAPLRSHRIKVRVKGRPFYRLHFRDSYTTIPDEDQLMRTLRSLAGATMQPATLPIAAQAAAAVYTKGVGRVPLEVSIPMDRLQYLPDAEGSRGRFNVYVSIFDAMGRNVGLARIPQDVTLRENEQRAGKRIVVTIPPMELAKGDYRVVVAVRDELTEAVGLTIEKFKV
jgi:VWFA-related protein